MSLMNTKQIIKVTKISRATLYRLIEEGLPYISLGTRKKMFDPNQVCEFIENRRNDIAKDLVVGQEYTNDEIVQIFRCRNTGEIRKSNTKNALVLISYHDKVDQLYEDYWRDNILYYTGVGQTGDQDINIAQNKTLAESKTNGVTVYLFEMFTDPQYIYRGIVQLAGEPFMERERGADKNYRMVWKFPLKLVASSSYLEGDLFLQKAEEADRFVSSMSKQAIYSRGSEIDRNVSEVTTTTKRYVKSPIIAQYAKDRAQGKCELCGKPAPFRVDNAPFLEPHHLQLVSEGGRDSIDNISALCPNCHRRMHLLRDPDDMRRLTKAVSDHNWWAATEDREYGERNTRFLKPCPRCGEILRIDIENYAEECEGERGRVLYEWNNEDLECEFCGSELLISGLVEYDEGGNNELDKIDIKEGE